MTYSTTFETSIEAEHGERDPKLDPEKRSLRQILHEIRDLVPLVSEIGLSLRDALRDDTEQERAFRHHLYALSMWTTEALARVEATEREIKRVTEYLNTEMGGGL